jgi:hypothetical protein
MTPLLLVDNEPQEHACVHTSSEAATVFKGTKRARMTEQKNSIFTFSRSEKRKIVGEVKKTLIFQPMPEQTYCFSIPVVTQA